MTNVRETVEPDYPADDTVEKVLAWAGDNKERLEIALAIEMKHEVREAHVTALASALVKLGFWGPSL